MKYLYRITRIFFLIVFTSFLFPRAGLAQKAELEVELFVSCVEDLGNDTLIAYFGYENPNPESITVQDKKSYVAYNYSRDEKYVISTFEPGIHDKVFSQEFRSDDWVRWTVKFSNYTKLARADSTSSLCVGELPIIPGYQPPEGGKQYLSKIGAELTSLYNAYNFDPSNFEGATDFIFQLVGTKVLIEVYAYDGQYAGMIFSLDSLGFDQLTSKPGLNYTTGWVEIADLLKLNDFADLFYARPVYPGVPNYIVPPTGVTKSQGDFAMHSDFARLGYEIDGSGVKIGVLSNSYNSKGIAHVDVQNGDLPGSTNPRGFSSEVEVFKDIAPDPTPLSDEGRAMLQIIHDVAPGAQLGFRTGFLGELDMAQGIREMADAGYNVIVDDLSYVTEPFFRDGIISQTIDSVVSEGVTFFSSAGNFGKTSYSGMYTPAAAPTTITGDAHNFAYLSGGSPDIFQGIELPPGSYMMVLQWDDGSDPTMNTTSTDLDLFLSDDVGFARLGFNRENIGGFPIEVVPFSVEGDTVISNILITRAGGPDVDVRFKYMLFRGGSLFKMLEYGDQGNSTIVGHPNAAGAISVGAVRFDKNPVYSPSLYPVPVIMSFSSVGGTPVNGVVRAKPDITAPNGVNTTVDLGNGDWDTSDPSNYPVDIDPDTLFANFFGTSAASPHAAGVAALIIEAKAKFDLDSTVGPETIRTLLKESAIDMETPGEDHISGAGFIQAHKALMTFAQPTPYIKNLINITDSLLVGDSIVPFTFTITGDFFTDSTQVLFRGEVLDSGVVVSDEHTIIVSHPGFLGNPEVQAYNPETSASELDGGTSNVKHFSDSVKQEVIITANNTSKKFGEELPEFTAHIVVVTVDGDTLTLDTAVNRGIVLQAEADRLSGLSFGTPAADSSDASIYIISPALDPPLDLDSIPNEVDFAISEKFILEFVNGNLVVEKLALTITPMDTSLVYGEMLPANGFQFAYQIGDSTVVISNPDSLLQSVQLEHTAALTNEIALVRGVALVNGIPVVRGTALVNGHTLLRGVALVNGVEVKVEVEGSDTTVFVAGEALVNGGTLVRGVALVNNRPFVSMTEIVRGTALVNGIEVNFADGYMSLDDDPLVNGIPVSRGVALVNGLSSRGVALVNGHTIVVENGITTIDGTPVPLDGLGLVNGVPVLRGVALVNSSLISRGVALVNGTGVVIENGLPTGRGVALVNGLPTTQRGVALVNGLPLVRGTALVNNLEVHVLDGEVSQVYENGALVNGINLSRGVALVNEVALVNGSQLISRGTALVNGIALTDEDGDGDELVNLENMNFMASSAAIANGLNSLRGVALVNGVESEDGEALKVAAGNVDENGNIVFENGFTSRGVALVNGLNYIRGTALVNGSPLSVRGTALVNTTTINENSNTGTILVFDATELGDTTNNNVGFTPISFITGTTVGQHWIVPGTYISNNYDISYGLGTLTIDPAPLTITADDKSKTFGEEDPVLTYSDQGLLGEDTLSGALIRETGEDVADYAILQGSLTAGENYTVQYDSATLSILPASMTVSITAEDKVYDGTRTATVALSDNRLSGSELDITFTSALFVDKHVAESKEVTVLGLSLAGADAGNYVANTEAVTTADITAKELVIAITADDKEYDGLADALTYASISSGLVADDDVMVSSSNGSFSDKHVATDKTVTADLTTSGADAGNYAANTTDTTMADITAKELVIAITADDKEYDGLADALTYASISSGLVADDIVTVSSSNGLFSDKHVATDKTVTADVGKSGTDAGNYAANITATTMADITAKELVIGITADNKVYDGLADALTYASISSGLLSGDNVTVSSSNGSFSDKHVAAGKTVTADVSSSGADAGNYAANITATTMADITAKELVIGITADDKEYDGLADAATYASISSGLVPDDAVTVSSSNGLFFDKNVGTWSVSADVFASGADAGNYTTNSGATTTAQITQRAVTVTPVSDFQYINEGDPLPSYFAFTYMGWIPGDAGNEGYTVLRDPDGIAYDPSSSESAGTYIVTPTPSNSNYLFTYETGILHVNPYGPGTRVVKPVLNCIQKISADYYVANFEYRNENNVAVYVPLGVDNILTGSGIDWTNSDPVPTMFASGGGSFRVFFDGSSLTWTVNSRDGDQKVSNAANANSSSTKCKGNPKSTAFESASIAENELDLEQLAAYPNPVVDKVYLSLAGIENYKVIKLYDFAGRIHPITSIDKRTDRLEIDMAELSPGHYFISVVMEDSTRVVQLIKN